MAHSTYKWDVFVSHNHKQKPWVRQAVQQWRDLGLRIFLDEDSIDPGEGILNGIERGLRGSRHIVFVITPDSVASHWVALETAVTFFNDSRAKKRRLIPLLLEPTVNKKLSLAVQGLNQVDLTDQNTCRQRYHQLLRFLKVTVEPLPDPPDCGVDMKGSPPPRILRISEDQAGGVPELQKMVNELRDLAQGLLKVQERLLEQVTRLEAERDYAIKRLEDAAGKRE